MGRRERALSGVWQGHLFAGWLKVTPVCSACRYPLGKVETGDGAATFIMQITGVLVGFPALAANLAWQPPLWVNLIIWPPLALVVALGLMRPGKGLMTALNLLRASSPHHPSPASLDEPRTRE